MRRRRTTTAMENEAPAVPAPVKTKPKKKVQTYKSFHDLKYGVRVYKSIPATGEVLEVVCRFCVKKRIKQPKIYNIPHRTDKYVDHSKGKNNEKGAHEEEWKVYKKLDNDDSRNEFWNEQNETEATTTAAVAIIAEKPEPPLEMSEGAAPAGSDVAIVDAGTEISVIREGTREEAVLGCGTEALATPINVVPNTWSTVTLRGQSSVSSVNDSEVAIVASALVALRDCSSVTSLRDGIATADVAVRIANAKHALSHHDVPYRNATGETGICSFVGH
jgi:hypothetical protein